MKKIIFILVLMICSCGSKKTLTSTTERYEKTIDSLERLSSKVQIDTIETFKDRIIVDTIETEIEVPVECDSLGIVKDFKFTTGSGPAHTSVEIINNKLVIKTAIDSIIQVHEKEYRSRYVQDSIKLRQIIVAEVKESSSTTKKTVKRGLPWWLYLIGALVIAAFIAKKLNWLSLVTGSGNRPG